MSDSPVRTAEPPPARAPGAGETRPGTFPSALVERLEGGVVVCEDLPGLRLTYANAGFSRLTGRCAGEALGRALVPLLAGPGADPASMTETEARLLAGGSATFRATGEGGAECELELTVARAPGRDGYPGQLLGVVRAVPADEPERLLRASARSLVESSPDVVTILSPEGTIRYASPSAEWILGHAPGELVGRSVREILHPDEAEAILGALAEGAGVPGPTVVREVRFRHRDGSSRVLECTAYSLLQDPLVGGGVARFRDLTGRLTGEGVLRHSEARYREFFEESLTANFVSRPDGRLLACNRAFAEMLGYGSVEDVLAVDAVSFYRSEEEREQLLSRLKERGRLEQLEIELVRRDGSPLHGVENIIARLSPSGEIEEIRGYLFDITSQKAAEMAREAAVAGKARFYSTLNHELRTPLYAMSLNNELLLSGACGELSEAQADAVARVQTSMQHLQDLVTDMLDLSRLDAGRLDALPDTVHLPHFLEEVLASLARMAGEHQSSLHLERGDEVPPIPTDPGRLRQIVVNLVANALRFANGGPVVVRCSATADHVAVEVVDRGAGIGPEDLPRVFDEFLQLPGRRYGGSGLGLTIARRLAGLLGGTLTAESTPGAGSTFRLTLPRTLPPE